MGKVEVTSRFLLYSDFNCPFCYALHDRLHDMDLLSRCEWRGVQHAPHLPRPMKPWDGALGAELRHEVAVVQRLAPGLPIVLPPGKPNTSPAIEQATQQLRMNRHTGMGFVRKVYQAFWCEGRDISDGSVLATLTEAGTLLIVDGECHRMAKEGEEDWHATGQAGVPLLVSPEGDLLVGCVSEEQVRRFFG